MNHQTLSDVLDSFSVDAWSFFSGFYFAIFLIFLVSFIVTRGH
jgi:hypothetical protein